MTTTNATAAPAAQGAKTTIRLPGREELAIEKGNVPAFAKLLEEQRDKRLAVIAKNLGFVPTLVEQKSDRLDFHEISVTSLKQMLLAAYNLGAADAGRDAVPCYENAKRRAEKGGK